MIMLERVNID